jgi:hypothetical protein
MSSFLNYKRISIHYDTVLFTHFNTKQVYLQLLISGMLSLEKSQAWSLWFGDMGASVMMNESGKNSAAY